MFSVLSSGQPFTQIIISADERSVNKKLAAWAASFVIQTLLFLTGRIHRFYRFNGFVYKLYSAFTGLEIAPSPSISTSTRSPSLSVISGGLSLVAYTLTYAWVSTRFSWQIALPAA